MKTEIIYEDKNILVCHKPPGIAVQTAKIGEMDVVSELKSHLAAEDKGYRGYLGVIHRLDQPVEGLLVFAKTKDAAAKLTKQLQEGSLNKDYLAVVCQSRETGLPLEGTLINEIAKGSQNKAVVRGASGEQLDYKKAVLHYKMTKMSCEKIKEQQLFMARIHIDTGRFHQIRAQMSYAGFPIVGDLKYGDDTSVAITERMNVHRVLLFADRICFSHPVTSRIMEFQIDAEKTLFLDYSLQKV